MKLHSILILSTALAAVACTSEGKKDQKVSTNKISQAKRPTVKKSKPSKVSPLTLENLLQDSTVTDNTRFDGTYLVADKYPILVSHNKSSYFVNWIGYEIVEYSHQSNPDNVLAYFQGEHEDYGRFVINEKSGRVYHEFIEMIGGQNDTTYFEAKPIKKDGDLSDDFTGRYSIIRPNRDSLHFEIKSVAPFKYNFTAQTGQSIKSICYRGRDRFGLMHYGNYFTMNSDHMSGLYSVKGDSNSTVVKLDTGEQL